MGFPRGRQCSTCDFSEPTPTVAGKSQVFRCRRYAPKTGSGGETYPAAVFPIVRADDWCGEWIKWTAPDVKA